MIIPCKHSGYGEGGRLTATRRAYMGSDSPGGGQTTSYTSNVPEYAEKPFMDMLGGAAALVNQPYQPYTGERTAQFTPLQSMAFENARYQTVAPQIGQATGIAGQAAQQAMQAGQFQPGTFSAERVAAPGMQYHQMQGPQSFLGDGTAQAYMNPYMQNVVDIQKREAQRAADIAGTQRGAQAVRAGAFGGSRQAIMDAEAQRNLAQQMGDIQATGSQAAFQQAQAQFNAEQQARQAAERANLEARLGVQSQGVDSLMRAMLANQQVGLETQRMGEQSRQFGADVGLRGAQTALQGAQQLGQLGQQQFGQQMDITGQQAQFGGMQQQQIQRMLDQQYADFQAQREHPYQQIGFFSDLLRGTGSSTRTVNPQPSNLQTLAGLGTVAAGYSAAAGGEVRYADGGITSLLGDQELAQTAQNTAHGPMMQMAAAQEAQERQMLRSAAPADMPQEADMTEAELVAALRVAIQQGDETKARVIAELIEERRMPESGIAQVAPESVGDVPEGGIMGMYNGGAVAFRSGDEVRIPYTPRKTSGQRMTDDALQALVEAYENMPDALPIQLAREGTRQTVDALGNVVEAVADTKAVPKSAGYLAQLERDEQAREARRAAARERELASKRTMTATPQAASASPLAAVLPESGASSAARDAKLLERQDPMSGGVARALAMQQAEEKAIADAGGNVATPGAGSGVMGPDQLMAMAKRFGIDPQAAADRQTAFAKDQAKARERGVSDREAALEAFIKERGVYGKEQEAEARKEIEGLAGKKLDAKNMALIQAGLAILSADPSRGAFAAIGEGAAKGLMGYKGDLEKLDAKREKINGRIDRILELRRLETTADGKDRLALKNERSKLEELAIQDHREIAGNLDKSKEGLGTTLFNAHLRQREAELNRVATAANLRTRSAGDLAQLRISLDGEIARLERKDFRTEEEESRLQSAISERNEVRRLLGQRSGMTGQATPAGGKVATSAQLPPGFTPD